MTGLSRGLLGKVGLWLFCTTAPMALAQMPEATVEVATVMEGQNSSVVRLPGTVISRRDADISAEVDGRLQWVAEVGDQIVKGEPVAVIDDHLLQLQLRNDKAEMARIEVEIGFNERQIKRLSKLADQNNMAQSELDEVESQLAMLTQELTIAEVRRDRTLYAIERTQVAAPFTGIVVSRAMDGGEYTEAGLALLRLVDTGSLEISVNAPLRVARYNEPGTKVHVASEDIQMLTAVRGLVPVGDPRSRMMELRLQLQPGKWFIGEAVTVELADGKPEMSLKVPRDALVLRDKEVFIYSVSADNKAIKVPVVAGSGQGAQITVEGDIAVGDPIVVRGAERLKEGQSVKVIATHLAAS